MRAPRPMASSEAAPGYGTPLLPTTRDSPSRGFNRPTTFHTSENKKRPGASLVPGLVLRIRQAGGGDGVSGKLTPLLPWRLLKLVINLKSGGKEANKEIP